MKCLMSEMSAGSSSSAQALWIRIQFINMSSRRQTRSARSRSTAATGPGTRSQSEPRHRPSNDAAAGGYPMISRAPDMERALAKRVNYRGSNIFRFGPTENFERGNIIKRARTEHDSELYPLPSLPGSVCVFRVRLVLLPNSVTSAILRLYHQLGSSG
jgi:hypothetical protein